MKRFIFFPLLLIFLQFSGCKEKVGSIAKTSAIKVVQNEVEPETEIEPDIYKNKYDLTIYTMSGYEKTEGKTTGFIALTERFNPELDKEKPVIDIKYLGKNIKNEFHTLDKIHRAQFLKEMVIKEDDSVFVYHYSQNQLSKYLVKNLPVLAFVSPYSSGEEIDPNDYVIGFDFPDKVIPIDDYAYFKAFISVGKLNPFQTGKIEPIIWTIPKTAELPAEIVLDKEPLRKLYHFISGNLNYYFINEKRLVVLNSNTKEIIYDQIFQLGEGGYMADLSFSNGETNYFGNEQFTGQLFKNTPPAIFGFINNSFGCERINFLNRSNDFVYLSCDNRH